jgi:hypothetical protein
MEPAMTATASATYDREITIRLAHEDDDLALRRLAQLDGARLPDGELLVAEVDGEPRAALRISDGAYVADPFYPSRELVGMLDVRARLLRRERNDNLMPDRGLPGIFALGMLALLMALACASSVVEDQPGGAGILLFAAAAVAAFSAVRLVGELPPQAEADEH